MTEAPPLAVVARPSRTPSGGFGLAALIALYTLTLRQHLHGKRWILLGVLFLTPAALAGILRASAPDVPSQVLEFMLVFLFIPQALLPLLALLYGSGIIQDELEEQTFTYLLMRPTPKWLIYLVKMAATLTTVIVLTAVFTALTYAAIYLGAAAEGENIPLRCCKAIGIHALAVTAYCCLFALMSMYTRWALVLGFLYAALFEGLFANLPFSIRWLTVIYYTRLIAYRSMQFLLSEPGMPRRPKIDMAAELWHLDVRTDPLLSEHPAMATCLTVLLAGSCFLMLWGAFLCARREFHVKTPEGS